MFDARRWAEDHGEWDSLVYGSAQLEAEEARMAEESQTMPEGRDPEEILREQQVLWVAGETKVGVKPGSFYHALIEAALRADDDNSARLGLVFPLVMLAVRRWTQGPLAQWYGIKDL